MGGIVQQILAKMSSGYRILLFLIKLSFYTVNSFTGIAFNLQWLSSIKPDIDDTTMFSTRLQVVF